MHRGRKILADSLQVTCKGTKNEAGFHLLVACESTKEKKKETNKHCQLYKKIKHLKNSWGVCRMHKSPCNHVSEPLADGPMLKTVQRDTAVKPDAGSTVISGAAGAWSTCCLWCSFATARGLAQHGSRKAWASGNPCGTWGRTDSHTCRWRPCSSRGLDAGRWDRARATRRPQDAWPPL